MGSSLPPLRLTSWLLRTAVGLSVLMLVIALSVVLVKTQKQVDRTPILENPLIVRIMIAEPVTIARVWEGYGTVRAMDSAEVAAQVSAQVVDRPERIEPGITVSEGEVLLQLDQSTFIERVKASQRRIEAWQAQLAGFDVQERRLTEQVGFAADEVTVEENELQRIIDALANGAGTDTERENRRANLRRVQRQLAALQEQLELIPRQREQIQAQLEDEAASLRLAKIDLERTTITAPIDGVLQSIGPDVGDLLSPGAHVARIVNLTRLEVPLRVPASADEGAMMGGEVELIADGADAGHWVGRVTRIAPEADNTTRTLTLYVEVRQPALTAGAAAPPPLRPGRFVIGRIRSTESTPRLLVPRLAALGDHVMLAESMPDKPDEVYARQVPVHVLYHVDGEYPRLAPDETQWAVIDAGLAPDQRVIISNLDQLHDGTRIVILDRDGVSRETETGKGSG